MLISIHPTRGKSTEKDVVQQMGEGWNNVEVSWAEAFELITVDGYATSAELKNGHRTGANFISRQLLMVDVDNEIEKNTDTLSIAQLLQHDFYAKYGAGYYATHSYKPQHEKFRICFVLESAETDPTRTQQLIRGLLKVFPAGDRACKDPVRLFYGSPHCKVKEFTNRVLPIAIAEQLIADIAARDLASQIPMMTTTTFTPPSAGDIGEILDELKNQYFDLRYEDRMSVVWSVLSACDPATTIQMMRSRWPDSHKTYRYEDFVKDGMKPYTGSKGKLGVGSLIKRIRQNNPKWILSKYKLTTTQIFNTRTITNANANTTPV